MGFGMPGETDKVMSEEDAYGLVMDAVRRHFRRNSSNRIDEIVVFHRLRREAMASIVDIADEAAAGAGCRPQITIELDDQARTWLADKGYDPIYGARPLKRVIQKQVQDPLAEEILRGTVKDGEHGSLSVRTAR